MQRGGGESDELGKHKIGEKKYFKIFRAKETIQNIQSKRNRKCKRSRDGCLGKWEEWSQMGLMYKACRNASVHINCPHDHRYYDVEGEDDHQCGEEDEFVEKGLQWRRRRR